MLAAIILVDENGNEMETKYLAERHSLSGGWKGSTKRGAKGHKASQGAISELRQRLGMLLVIVMVVAVTVTFPKHFLIPGLPLTLTAVRVSVRPGIKKFSGIVIGLKSVAAPSGHS
nr:B3 domain-containing protein Os01g0234100-like [Ipomoea batatas]